MYSSTKSLLCLSSAVAFPSKNLFKIKSHSLLPSQVPNILFSMIGPNPMITSFSLTKQGPVLLLNWLTNIEGLHLVLPNFILVIDRSTRVGSIINESNHMKIGFAISSSGFY